MTVEAKLLVKTLSRNDLGLTGGHQGGILVPRVEAAFLFFPALDATQFNPRTVVCFRDEVLARDWDLNFIYYNGRLLRRSSRNEYRLTGLTGFFRSHDAVVGDELEFREMADGSRTLQLRRANEIEVGEEPDPDVIVLSGKWKTIRRGNFL